MHPQYTPSGISHFWSRVNRTDNPDECWEWTGLYDKRGYGRTGIGAGHGNKTAAHRVSWELTHGPIPDGMSICHTCDNPPCCNPAHLFLGTHSDNMSDCVAKGRHRGGASKGSEHHMAKLDEAAVLAIRQEHAVGKVTLATLGRRYGVTKEHIFSIVKYKVWKHV